MIEILKDKVVSITYILKEADENGQVVEQVTGDNPLTFIFGTGGMLPKFEEKLDGKKSGDAFRFGLNYEDAYGPVIENAIVDVPVDVFKVDGQIDNNMLKIGNTIPMMDNSGNKLNGLIREIMDSTVKMDFNHPMAGKDLFFEGEITDVREATEEELSHGHIHAHGECDGSCESTESGCSCGV